MTQRSQHFNVINPDRKSLSAAGYSFIQVCHLPTISVNPERN